MVDLLGVVAMFAPVLLILWFANLGQKMREQGVPHMAPVVVAYLLMALIYAFLALFGLVALLAQNVAATQPEVLSQFAGQDNPLAHVTSWAWLTWGMVLPALVGLLLMLKPVRRFVARFTQLDPEHPVHTIALALTMMPLIMLALALGMGLGNLAGQLAQQTAETGAPPVTLLALWMQTLMFIILALIGVGWLSRRSFGAALTRLGIVRPTLRQVLIGVGVAVLLVPAVALLENLLNMVGLGVGQDVEQLTQELTGPLFSSPWGILSIGLAAALGEEPIFRGAMQPRFGIVITALVFALVHSQYGISAATVIVFGLGLVLGWVRARNNTTTSIITHAVYNSSLGLLAALAASALQR